jgi:hypothetical protein
MPEADKKRIPGSTFGMAGVFWVASGLSRRNWIAMPTVRNQKGVDIIATATRPSGSKFVEIQVKSSQGRGFWLLGPMKRKNPESKMVVFSTERALLNKCVSSPELTCKFPHGISRVSPIAS